MVVRETMVRTGLVGFLLLGLLGLASIASAAELQVTSTNDAGPGTLRQVIFDAAPGDTITFASGGQGTTYLDTPLTIDKSLTIAGTGSGSVVISGSLVTELIHMDNDASLTLSGVTLTEGIATSAEWAAVLTNPGSGTATLDRVVVQNNIAEVDLLSNVMGSARLDAFRRAAASLNTSALTTSEIRSLAGKAPAPAPRGRAAIDLPSIPVDLGCLTSGSCLVPGVSVIWSGSPYWGDDPAGGGTSHLVIRDSTISDNDATGGIVDSVSGRDGSVDVSGTTFSGNNAKPGPGLVGPDPTLTIFLLPALVVAGSSPVTITSSAFTRNTGLLGSAVTIFSSSEDDQPVTIRGSSFVDNGGVIFGPLIVTGVAGTVAISGSDFSGNSPGSSILTQLIGSYGGGATIIAARTTIDHSRFADNAATVGGALIVAGDEFSMTSSTVVGNDALLDGGVVMGPSVPFFLGSLGGLASGTITNSTIVGNTQLGFGSAEGAGGLALGRASTLVNDTITGNAGGVGAGGVLIDTTLGQTTTVRNSIISGNRARDGANMRCAPFGSAVVLQGANLISPDATSTAPCSYDTTEHLLTSDPKLGTLGTYNWGTSSTLQTVPLLAGSPGIDAALGDAPTADARDISRAQGRAPDVGAYEARPAQLVLSASAPASLGLTSPIGYTLSAANVGDLAATGVALTSNLTGYVRYVSASGIACTWATAVLTCPVGTLDGGTSTTSTVTAKAIVAGTATIAWTLAAPGLASATASTTTQITTSQAPMSLYGATQMRGGMMFKVRTSSGGTISVTTGLEPAGRAGRAPMCKATQKVQHATTATIWCRYSRAARSRLRAGATRAMATITFTPTVGAKTTMQKRMRLHRIGIAPKPSRNPSRAEQPTG